MYSAEAIDTYNTLFNRAVGMVKESAGPVAQFIKRQGFLGKIRRHLPTAGIAAVGAGAGLGAGAYLGNRSSDANFYRGLGTGAAMGGVTDPEKVQFLMQNAPQLFKFTSATPPLGGNENYENQPNY